MRNRTLCVMAVLLGATLGGVSANLLLDPLQTVANLILGRPVLLVAAIVGPGTVLLAFALGLRVGFRSGAVEAHVAPVLRLVFLLLGLAALGSGLAQTLVGLLRQTSALFVTAGLNGSIFLAAVSAHAIVPGKPRQRPAAEPQ